MKEIKFDKRASEYDEGFEGKSSERFYRSLVNTVKLKKGFRVLDVGCGTGTILYRISRSSEARLKAPIDGYGIDVSEAMLNEARRKCPQMNFQIGDSGKLPFEDNSFDVITACMAYHHFPPQKAFRKEALRVLKPNGRLYICDPRFPLPIRAAMNGVFRLSGANACFYSSDEMNRDFVRAGFSVVGVKKDLYVQTLVYKKK